MNRTVMAVFDEQKVIARAIQGDRAAYAQLVVHYQPTLYAAAYRMCGDPDLAEDATQQAFIQSWLHLADFTPRDNLRGWLYRVTINATLDMLRRQKRVVNDPKFLVDRVDPGQDPESSSETREQKEIIQGALLRLSEANRSVLVMREYGDLSYHEIARALDIPIGTVMSRLNTARKQLRMILAPWLTTLENDNE